MNIQPISKNKFIVRLSCDDMVNLDITYDEMDYSNIETRRVIWTILDTVRQDTGRDVDPSGNLVIEAAPDTEGGCILMFTVPAGTKIENIGTKKARKNSTCIYEFKNVDDYLDFLSVAQFNNSTIRLFSKDEKYRIEISNDYAEKTEHALNEYAKRIGRDYVSISSTHEHWRELSAS